MRLAIRACQRCGSDDLRMAGLRDGAMVGEGQELAKWACERCGLVAVPLLFDDQDAREAFETARASDPSASWPESGWPSLRRPFRKD